METEDSSIVSQGMNHTGTDESIEVPEICANELILEPNPIGRGGYGTVYKGTCRGKTVAVKKLHSLLELEENELSVYRKEIAILSHLRHPNVLLLMGACTEPGQFALVTEYAELGDLHTILRDKKNYNLSLTKKVQIAMDVASGMLWLHTSKPPIIHRDLKSKNVLIDAKWNVKICDFGLSAFQRNNKTIQDTDIALGTPLWMSPEVLQGLPLDEKSDVYSFGILFWEILTGEEPFQNYEEHDAFLEAVCDRHERPPIPEDLPPCIGQVLNRCWAPNPSDRPGFSMIGPMLEEALVDCNITNDNVAAHFWKENFSKMVHVPWQDFVGHFYKTIQCYLPVGEKRETDTKYLCLFTILANETPSGRVGHFVSLERFGIFLKWFGPLNRDILDLVQNTLSLPYFFGDINKNDTEDKLNGQKSGTFLIRFSFFEPEKYPFSISKVGKKNNITHQRITRNSAGILRLKTKADKTTESTNINGLITSKSQKDLQLRRHCAGSPFIDLFKKKPPRNEDNYAPLSDDD